MALIVYNKENSRPQQVVYQGKRTINMDSKGTVYLSKTMSIELGILGGGRVNFAHDEDTGEWYICHTTDKDGFTVWKDKRCARFSAGFIVRRIMLQAKVERKTVQFMIAKAPIEVGCLLYTSDAADEEDSVDLGGRRILKKKKKNVICVSSVTSEKKSRSYKLPNNQMSV